MTSQKRIKVQCVYNYALCIFLLHQIISSFLVTIGLGFFGNSKIMAFGGYLLFFGMMFFASLFALRNWNIDTIVVLSALLMNYLISYLVFPMHRSIIFTSLLDIGGNPFYLLFIFAFPGYLFVRKVREYEKLVGVFKNFSIAAVLMSLVTFVYWNNIGEPPQYLSFSYGILLPTTFLILLSMERKKWDFLAVGLVGFILILLAGGRGALVSLICTVIVYLFMNELSPIRKLTLILLFGILGGLIYWQYSNILDFLLITASQHGIDSRTIRMMKNSQFLDDSGRFDIIIENVKNFSVFGLGMYGDRFISGNSFTSYPHNLFVELLVQYGYLLGSVLIILILVLIYKAISIKCKDFRLLSIALLSTGFFKLLFSSSYLSNEPGFYVLLGLGVNAAVINRNMKDPEI